MGNNNKTSDSSSNQRPQSKLDHEQTWSQLKSKYLCDLPQQLERIRTTLEIRDYTKIKKQAHRIKGTSGTYRLEGISKGIAHLERLADSRNPDAIATAIKKVTRLVELETNRLNSPTVSSVDSSERIAGD